MNNLEPINSVKNYQFGIGRAFFLTIIATTAMQVVGGIVSLPAIYYKVLNHVVMPLGFLIGIICAIATLLGLIKGNLIPVLQDIKRKITFTEIIISIFLWIGMLPLCELLTSLIPTEGGFLGDLYQQFTEIFMQTLDYKVAGFITICILAPIFEEIVFRGIILKGMLNNPKIHPMIAILFGGIFFGFAHLNPWQFIGAGLLGCVFGYVYYRTKSLVIPMVLHAINNIISYSIMIQNQDMEEMVFNTSDYVSISIFAVLGIIMGILLYRVTQKKV